MFTIVLAILIFWNGILSRKLSNCIAFWCTSDVHKCAMESIKLGIVTVLQMENSAEKVAIVVTARTMLSTLKTGQRQSRLCVCICVCVCTYLGVCV